MALSAQTIVESFHLRQRNWCIMKQIDKYMYFSDFENQGNQEIMTQF